MKRRLSLESLDDRRMLSAAPAESAPVDIRSASIMAGPAAENVRPVLTVITHGFTAKTDQDGTIIIPFEPGEFPLWVYDLATAVHGRLGSPAGTEDLNGDGILDVIQNAKIDLDLNQPSVGAGQAWDQLILFDWVEQSVTAGTANNNAVAGKLAQAVSSQLDQISAGAAGGKIDLHLIGFSRGSFVTVDSIRRLSADPAATLIGRLQMTTLDPQPFNGLFDSDGVLEGNPGGIVDWADNYYQQAGTGFFDEGEPINGAYNVDLTDIVHGWPGRNEADANGVLNHSEVHDWYHWTVDAVDDVLAGYQDDAVAAQDDVFVNAPQLGRRDLIFPRAEWEQGAKVGYYWSKNGGGMADRPSPWQNEGDLFDVNGDGNADNDDISTIINMLLNTSGGGKLADLQIELYDPPRFPDVNGDLFLTYNDALRAISHLRNQNAQAALAAPAGGAEASLVPPLSDADDDDDRRRPKNRSRRW